MVDESLQQDSDNLRPAIGNAILDHIEKVEGQRPKLIKRPIALSGGHVRLTFKLPTDMGDYVAAISYYPNSQEFPDLRRNEGHNLQKFLYENGASVPKPIGDLLVLPSRQNCQVMQFVPGILADRKVLTIPDMKAIGEALAKFHAISEGYVPGLREEREAKSKKDWENEAEWAENLRRQGLPIPYELSDPPKTPSSPSEVDAIARKRYASSLATSASIAADRVDRLQLKGKHRLHTLKAAEDLKEAAATVPDIACKEGLEHTDTKPANMIIQTHSDAKVLDTKSILIDFQHSDLGIPFRDVARTLLMTCFKISKSDGKPSLKFSDNHAKALLEGYTSVIPLSDDEKKAVFDMVKVESKFFAAFPKHNRLLGSKISPEGLRQWSSAVDLWVDRLAHSSDKGGQDTHIG